MIKHYEQNYKNRTSWKALQEAIFDYSSNGVVRIQPPDTFTVRAFY